MFKETDRASVTRAKDTLKTSLQLLSDVTVGSSSPYRDSIESQDKEILFQVEKKVREALQHLEEIK